jgi:hypothetical protein
MKVVALEIKKRESYEEYANEFVGVVQIVGGTGKMEVRLSPRTVLEIFKMCVSDVQRVADYNASQATIAVKDISDSILLSIENKEIKQPLLPF